MGKTETNSKTGTDCLPDENDLLGNTSMAKKWIHLFLLCNDPDSLPRRIRQRLKPLEEHLRSKGVRVIKVTVDSENEAALALYQSVGFEVYTSSLWYEKKVN